MKYYLTFLSLFFFSGLLASDTLIISRLLQRIDELQPKEDGVFPKGSIPSYRIYALNKDRQKADINAFYTGLVAFTLNDIQRDFAPAQQKQAKQIVANTLPVFAKFRNRRGRDTYNFWPTDTPQVFPHSGWINLFDKVGALPDDLDDTVIMLLALNAPDSTARAIHALMQSFTNNDQKKIRNTFAEYQDIGAYSTWFGEKMPVDFDICVLANVLYFVQTYNLSWTAADSASLLLIEKVLEDRRHITAAAQISPHYSKLPNILYHLSRLMSVRPIPSLEKFRPQLVADAHKALGSAGTFMDEVILSTALLRWNTIPPQPHPRRANNMEELVEDDQFAFFIANWASMLPGVMKRWIGGAAIGKFYYHCPAYNHVLLLENLVWRKRRGL